MAKKKSLHKIPTKLMDDKGQIIHEGDIVEIQDLIETKTSYAKGTATIKFDKSKASIEQLQNAIAQTGYKVINYQLLIIS